MMRWIDKNSQWLWAIPAALWFMGLGAILSLQLCRLTGDFRAPLLATGLLLTLAGICTNIIWLAEIIEAVRRTSYQSIKAHYLGRLGIGKGVPIDK